GELKMYSDPIFCFKCGRKLIRKYPMGDPENGPRSYYCPDDCTALEDVIATEVESALYELTHEDSAGGPQLSVGEGDPIFENEQRIAWLENYNTHVDAYLKGTE